MTEPEFPPRLNRAATDDFVRRLLRTARRDVSELPRAERALASYLSARGDDSVDASSRPKAPSSRWLLAKLLGPMALVGAIGFGSELGSTHELASAPPVSPAIASTASASIEPAAREVSATAVRIEDLPSVPEAPAAPTLPSREPAARRLPRSSTEPAPSTRSLDDELALVEAARASLSHGSAEECLRALDAYERRFAGGLLEHEVAAMRIEALAAHGEPARARALAKTFLATSPSSPYASRIRSVLATLPE